MLQYVHRLTFIRLAEMESIGVSLIARLAMIKIIREEYAHAEKYKALIVHLSLDQLHLAACVLTKHSLILTIRFQIT